MTRYKVVLQPQGAIPKDVDIGVHLTKAAAPSGGCVAECDGWTVTIKDAPSTGDLHGFDDAAFTATIELAGTLCPGQCIAWEIRALNAVAIDDITITPDGCTKLAIDAAGTMSYAGSIFAIFPTIDGKPFCTQIVFQMVTCVDDPPMPSMQFGTSFDLDGLTFNSVGLDTRGYIDIQLIGGLICDPGDISWAIVQTAGPSNANGETIVFQFEWAWWLVFTSIVDLTDCVFVATPTVNGLEHPELAVTLTCTNV